MERFLENVGELGERYRADVNSISWLFLLGIGLLSNVFNQSRALLDRQRSKYFHALFRGEDSNSNTNFSSKRNSLFLRNAATKKIVFTLSSINSPCRFGLIDGCTRNVFPKFEIRTGISIELYNSINIAISTRAIVRLDLIRGNMGGCSRVCGQQ